MSEPIKLTGYYEEINDSVRALLFGQMVKRAVPVVKQYHSDLFHDAAWLKNWVVGPMTFDFVVRDYGTHIGTDCMEHLFHLPDGRHGALCGDKTAVGYKVTLSCERGMWSVTFDQVTTPVCA